MRRCVKLFLKRLTKIYNGVHANKRYNPRNKLINEKLRVAVLNKRAKIKWTEEDDKKLMKGLL